MPARKFGGTRFSRWQDKGDHPASAIVKVITRRAKSLQVIAGSATLDSGSKKKLESILKKSPSLKKALPLRTVTLKGDLDKLQTKIKRSEGGTATERSTIVLSRAFVILPHY